MAGGFCFICTIVCFAFMEETSYDRPTAVQDQSGAIESTAFDEKHEDSKDTMGAAPTRETALTDNRALQGHPKSLVARMAFMRIQRPVAWRRVLVTGFVQPLLAGFTVPVVWYGAFQFGIYQVSRVRDRLR